MMRFSQLARAFKIISVLIQYHFNRRVLSPQAKKLRLLSYLNPWSYSFNKTRGQALRMSLETLGPIFVKFGQLLSLRDDMLPEDVIIELTKLKQIQMRLKGKQTKQMLMKHFSNWKQNYKITCHHSPASKPSVLLKPLTLNPFKHCLPPLMSNHWHLLPSHKSMLPHCTAAKR